MNKDRNKVNPVMENKMCAIFAYLNKSSEMSKD